MFKTIAKLVALPIRVVDLPFKVVRKLVDESNDPGPLEDVAKVVEDSVVELDGK